MDPHDQIRRLHGMPSARHKGTREIPKELGTFPSLQHAWERRLASGQAGAQMSRHQQPRQGTRAAAVCRLDRSHQSRRGAAGAAASARPRAQRGDHDVGLGGSEGVSARRGVDRSTQANGQRQRPAVRRARIERRLRAGARSEHDTTSQIPLAVRDPNTPPTSPKMAAPSPYSVRKRSGPARTTFTTRCSTSEDGCG